MVGPHSDGTTSINKGVAAHISSASPGGKRYDPSLDSEERSSISNGIWLCQNCAKLIDSDEIRFPSDLLKTWKAISESRAADSLLANVPLVTNSAIAISTPTQTHREWITDHLYTAKLSAVIPRVLQFARETQNAELEKWSRLELFGYLLSYGMSEDEKIPDHRHVLGQWIDPYDEPCQFPVRLRDMTRRFPMHFGVAKLESLSEGTEMKNITDKDLEQAFWENLRIEAVRFCFSPLDMKNVLTGIRQELDQMLLNV